MAGGPLGAGVEVPEETIGIAEEIDDVVPVVVVRHRPAKWREETLRRIGLRGVGRGWDQTEPVPVAFHRLADYLGPLGRADPGVVEQDDRHPTTCLRARDEVIELVDEGRGGAAGREAPGAPAVAPVDGGKPDRL